MGYLELIMAMSAGLIPIFIGIGLAVYFLTLFKRLIRTVEKIADNLEK
jgi:uncharacterized membrane protein